MDRKKTAALAALLFIITWIAYANTLHHPFVYDDLILIESNKSLENPSNYKQLFTQNYFKFSGERSYRPVCTAVSMLDAQIGGRSPFPFRVTSVLVHSTAGQLVFFLLLAFGASQFFSFTAALVFLLHPVMTEAVNGISFIEDPLSTALFLASFLMYMKCRKKFLIPSFFTSMIFAMLAMLSKETAATLPLCIVMYELTLCKKSNNSNTSPNPAIEPEALSKSPSSNFAGNPSSKAILIAGHFAVLIIYVVIRFFIFGNKNPAAAAEWPGGSLHAAVPVMSVALLQYLKLFFYPLKLTVEHCLSYSYNYSSMMFWFSTALHAGLLVFAIASLRTAPMMGFGLLFYLLNLLPISNIIPFGALMAERYAYLPSLGLCIFLVSLFIEQKPKVPEAPEPEPKQSKKHITASRAALGNKVFILSLTIFFGILTIQRNTVWRSGLSLWKDAVASCPQSSRARTSYGRELIKIGDYKAAADQLREAVAIDPQHYEAQLSLGAACFSSGDYQCALSAYLAAMRFHPSNDVRYNIAILYLATGAPEKAAEFLQTAIKRQPQWPAAHYLLGNSYLKRNPPDYAHAEEQYKLALMLNPGLLEAKGNLGVVYAETNRPALALKEFKEILKADPSNHFAADNLARLEKKKAGE